MRRWRVGGIAVGISAAVLASGCTGSSLHAQGQRLPTSPASVNSSTAGKPPLPALDAATYPESIYPPPTPGKKAAVLECPGIHDLEQPTAGARRQAVRIAEYSGSWSRSRVLHTSDRATWTYTRIPAPGRTPATRPRRQPVLSSGPLLGRYTGGGTPNPAGWVRHDCPPRVARDSYEVVVGPRSSGALDEASVFVERRGRVLLYFSYP